jgi:hypothetical protein
MSGPSNKETKNLKTALRKLGLNSNKVLARSGSEEAVEYLIRALAQKYGNKRYLQDLERLLNERLDGLSGFDLETIWHLIRNIKND